MKKLAKILTAMVLTVLVAVGAVACGGKTMDSAYDMEKVPTVGSYSAATKINADGYKLRYDGAEPLAKYGYAIFSKSVQNGENTDYQFMLYDLVNNNSVATKTQSVNRNPFELVSLDYLNGLAIHRKITYVQGVGDVESKDATVYYNGTSTQAKFKDADDEAIFNSDAGLMQIGDTVFVNNDGVVSAVTNDRIDISTIDYGANGYYYADTDNGILVYDASFNLYGRIVLPTYANEANINILANGNLLIQYEYAADQYSSDYTFLSDKAEKTVVKTVLYDAEKNSDKEIKFEYILAEVSSMKEGLNEYLSKKVDNVATVYEIKDKRVDENDSSALIVSLSNKGEIEKIYEKANDLLVTAGLSPIANGIYQSRNIAGQTVLFNEEMEVIGTYASIGWYNATNFLANGKIYDYTGAVVVDLEKEEYSIEEYKADALILEKTIESEKTYEGDEEPTTITTTEYYLFVGGNTNLQKIASYSNDREATTGSMLYIEGDYESFAYCVVSATKGGTTEAPEVNATYSVYNTKGELLKSFDFKTVGENADTDIEIEFSNVGIDGYNPVGIIVASYARYNTTDSAYENIVEYYVVK